MYAVDAFASATVLIIAVVSALLVATVAVVDADTFVGSGAVAGIATVVLVASIDVGWFDVKVISVAVLVVAVMRVMLVAVRDVVVVEVVVVVVVVVVCGKKQSCISKAQALVTPLG